MKNECSYVRDVLPLYFENMVSEDTAAFVEEHLKTCPGCFSELEAMRAACVDYTHYSIYELTASFVRSLLRTFSQR